MDTVHVFRVGSRRGAPGGDSPHTLAYTLRPAVSCVLWRTPTDEHRHTNKSNRQVYRPDVQRSNARAPPCGQCTLTPSTKAENVHEEQIDTFDAPPLKGKGRGILPDGGLINVRSATQFNPAQASHSMACRRRPPAETRLRRVDGRRRSARRSSSRRPRSRGSRASWGVCTSTPSSQRESPQSGRHSRARRGWAAAAARSQR